jgi:hypothetical protein
MGGGETVTDANGTESDHRQPLTMGCRDLTRSVRPSEKLLQGW